VLERPEPAADDALGRLLAAEDVEVIDKRASGGSLWVIGGPELGGLMERLAGQGFKFVFAKEGGRASKRRPAWWIK
jgi:hypothetical protein